MNLVKWEKSLCLPFAVSESVSVEPLAKIHCDLWGPLHVMSLQGFKFYAFFIDDHYRFSWFYPLKLKSDFYEVSLTEKSKNFRVMVEENLQVFG